VPTAGAWGATNDDDASRDVYCVLSRQDKGNLTGSIDVTDAS
jgi:hypothetical protein